MALTTYPGCLWRDFVDRFGNHVTLECFQFGRGIPPSQLGGISCQRNRLAVLFVINFQDGNKSQRGGALNGGPIFAWKASIVIVHTGNVKQDANGLGTSGTIKVEKFWFGHDDSFVERQRQYQGFWFCVSLWEVTSFTHQRSTTWKIALFGSFSILRRFSFPARAIFEGILVSCDLWHRKRGLHSKRFEWLTRLELCFAIRSQSSVAWRIVFYM